MRSPTRCRHPDLQRSTEQVSALHSDHAPRRHRIAQFHHYWRASLMGSIQRDAGDASPDASVSMSAAPADSRDQDQVATATLQAAARATTPPANQPSLITTNLDRQYSIADSPSALSATQTPVPDELATPARTAVDAPLASSLLLMMNEDELSTPASSTSAQAYGTRSRRNRPGTSRPNYAEDHDMDLDYETVAQTNGSRNSTSAAASTTGAKANNHGPTSAAASASGSASTPSTTTTTQKRLASASASASASIISNGWSAVNSAPSPPANTASSSGIPGTLTFSANPKVNVSKKRKAGGAAVSSGSGSSSSGSGHAAQVQVPVQMHGSAAAATATANANANANSSTAKSSQQQANNTIQLQGAAFGGSANHIGTANTTTRRANQNASLNPANATSTSTNGAGRSSSSSSSRHQRASNTYTFGKTQAKLLDGKLVADDGTVFAVNDHVYLVCEPPGDPYYLGRIMEFRSRDTDDVTAAAIDSLRINWVYRPRDVQRLSVETRLVFATMHSDICPLASLRGKCVVSHKNEFDSVDEYKKSPDHFYFTQVFDRFMHRWFEVIPTVQVVNVPEAVKQALDSRWKYIVVEASKVKELTSDAKRCKRCSGYCASNDSVDCAVCHLTYHMCCVRPPLLKKPSRGFAWACGPCSRAQERKLEARRTPVLGSATPDVDEEELVEEEEDDAGMPATGAVTPEAMDDRPATDAEVAHAKMWTMRYLGIHCRVEDALQYDDRAIFPRAGSRLGPRHQANVLPWYGRPIELVKPTEIKKKYIRIPGKKDSSKMTKETQAAIEADRLAKLARPPYIQDEPPGYVRRGEDHPNKDKTNTAVLYFKMPEANNLPERGFDEPVSRPHDVLQHYMTRAEKVAKLLGVQPSSVDFIDRALYCLQDCNYDADVAIKQLRRTDPVGKWPDNKNHIRKDLRDPHLSFSADEKKRFEEGVAIYGSELRGVRATVETQSHADIVRYWYHWKKSAKGHEIWGSSGGRKNTKKAKAETEVAAKLVDDIAHDQDDSAFDNGKIEKRSRKMVCKHCSTRHSRIWRRAPGVSPGQTMLSEGRLAKREALVVALCDRCARLWRRYAIKWENMDEIMKKLAQVGSKSWKKKLDPELLREIELFNDNKGRELSPIESPPPEPQIAEPAKKKARHSLADGQPTESKKKAPPAQPAPPPAPLPPLPVQPAQMKQFPCLVCHDVESEHDPLVICRDCRLTVHRRCYGVSYAIRGPNKWTCDMCSNDRRDMASGMGSSVDPASYTYCCVLCPIEQTPRDMVQPPRIHHSKKKKEEREKIKEAAEKELAIKLGHMYKETQRDLGRPLFPREALKRTADNNWVHVTCAMFVPEIKFSSAKTLDVAEGVPFALRNRSEHKCTLCNTNRGAAVSCHASGCHKTFHAMCAAQAGCKWGFDITPVKNSRKDSEAIVTMGQETGRMNAVMWCKEHSLTVKTAVYPINERVDEDGTTAIQFYALSCKQADETVTGTTRKANQLDEYTKLAALTDPRKLQAPVPIKIRLSGSMAVETPAPAPVAPVEEVRYCATCNIESTPKWWKLGDEPMLNGHRRDHTMSNGVKAEGHHSRESSMRVEALLQDVHSGQARDSARIRTPGHSRSASAIVRYECHKCHHHRLHPPPVSDEMDVDEMGASPVPHPATAPAPAPAHTWGPVASIPAPPAPNTWPPTSQYNGQAGPGHSAPYVRPAYGQVDSSYPPREPYARESTYPRQDLAYPAPEGYAHHTPHPVANGLPTYPSGSVPPQQILPAPPAHQPPPSYHASPHGTPSHVHSHIAPNGIAPHSPSHAMPSHVPRHSHSPYQAVQPHPAAPAATSHAHPYSHHHAPAHHHPHHASPVSRHHGSPVARPLSGLDHAPIAPAPAPARSTPHGASGSASVRNLID